MLTVGYHNNISNEDLMNDLFAYRIQIMDSSTNEHFIIRKLKFRLINMGYLEENLNVIIYSFYNYFDIPITLNEIENIPSTLYTPLFFNNPNTIINPLNIFISHINNELNLDTIKI